MANDINLYGENVPCPEVENSPTNIFLCGKDRSFEMRPSASSGWWLCCLLPIAYLVNCWQHTPAVSFDYKMSTIVAFGLFLQTLVIIGQLYTKLGRIVILRAVPSTVTATLIFVCLHQGFVVSAIIGLATKFAYNSLFFYILLNMPRSFTFGEASIVTQGVIIFILNVLLKLATIPHYNPLTNMEKMSSILQVGLTGIGILIALCHFVIYFRGIAFYAALAVIGFVIIACPIGQNPAVIVFAEFLFDDLQRLCVAIIYVGLLGITVAAVSWHLSRNQASTTSVRKIFHILTVLAFLPGFIYQCTLLFTASGVILAIMMVLETMRVIQLKPFAKFLDSVINSFVDEKDVGIVAVTPFYLLVGCALPIWLHPCPCDLTDVAGFELLPLMAGVISVGLGDTAASVIGSKFGRVHWPNSIKTVEGTVAAIVVQAVVLPILIYCGFVQYNPAVVAKYLATVTINSVVETFTNQSDNIVLPLLTFILLSV